MADGSALQPAAAIAHKNRARQPNESAEYRKAREALLIEEIELNRHIARVAAQRRALPPGGEVKGDYQFIGEASSVAGANPVGFEELFGDKDTLFVYNWMYGPKRQRPCPMCTALLSCLDGNADHLRQRIALAIVGLSAIERQIAFKVERGWKNLPFYADVNGNFSRDYHAIMDDGTDTAAENVFTRRDGTIRHFWGAELGFESADPGKRPDDRAGPDDAVERAGLDAGRSRDRLVPEDHLLSGRDGLPGAWSSGKGGDLPIRSRPAQDIRHVVIERLQLALSGLSAREHSALSD